MIISHLIVLISLALYKTTQEASYYIKWRSEKNFRQCRGRQLPVSILVFLETPNEMKIISFFFPRAELFNLSLINISYFNFSQSLESISKELVAKLQARLAHWDVNTTQIGDILVEMVSNDMLNIIMCNYGKLETLLRLDSIFSLNSGFSVEGSVRGISSYFISTVVWILYIKAR